MSRLHYLQPQALEPLPQNLTTDICIYGGTSAGVIAALQTARMGKSAILLEPSFHLGGLSAGGLSYTDFGKKQSVGGLSREFYQRTGKAYNNIAPGLPGVTVPNRPNAPIEEWCFEPHIAERIFDDMLTEAWNLTKVQLFKPQLLKSVEMATTGDKRIASITMHSGLTVAAKIFLDCSYEGDLMAKAGVSFHVGRESNSAYGETLNGAQIRDTHQFNLPVSPFTKENDPTSGLLPGIEPQPPTPDAGDHRVQAYNFRLCLTQDKSNLVPFQKPENYSPAPYELLARYFAAGATLKEITPKFDPLRGNKVDKNNHGALSTDFIGANYAYPNADYQTREKIFQAHVAWTKGLLHFLGHDPRVPPDVRDWWNSWGLCKDEFGDCGGFSHALYIREARRMISDYIMLEQDCKCERTAEDPVGMGSYGMDSHNCQRFSDGKLGGQVKNEGDVQIGLKKPYAISYRSIIPRIGECENLLVPVCCSSSHIAYGSIRMEPVFMVLGHSAATAAVGTIEAKTPLQKLPYPDLKKLLLAQNQVLSLPV